MVSNFYSKINKGYDLAVKYLLFAGSLYFVFYTLQSGKIIYILLSIAIYLLSYFLRNKIFKTKSSLKFTESGMFLLSFLFLAYFLLITGIDSEVENFLPDKVLVQSGIGFIFIISISLFFKEKEAYPKFISIVILVITLTFLYLNQTLINNFFISNSSITKYIIGTPIVYIFLILTGLQKQKN